MSAIGSKKSKDEVNLKYMWHLRLDHIREARINRLVKDDLLDSFLDESILVCESCLQKKMIKLPFIGYEKRTTEVLALVHTNVCGSFDMLIRGGYLYFTSLSMIFYDMSVFLMR